MAKNERKTEDLVHDRLRALDYFNAPFHVEKQSSDSIRIQRLLEHASKQGDGSGRPEFIIHSDKHPNFLIVIECKADTKFHVSPQRNRPRDFAVDGVLLYASFLSRDYDVLAIAVSGETDSTLQISHHFHLRGQSQAVDWPPFRKLSSFEEYYDSFLQSDLKFRQDYGSLLDYSRQLNKTLQAKKITESDRGFLISGVLIALQNDAFRKSYRLQRTADELANDLTHTIKVEFKNSDVATERLSLLDQAFSFIPISPPLTEDRDFLVGLIQGIDENMNSFMKTHAFYDTIGQFYVEFLRYANNDKGLGIVLTPPHIAELFAELAGVDKDSYVYDNCCGTAGLLIAAMNVMIKSAGADKKMQNRIKKSQLFGIEYQTKIYALAVSNMVLHGDGKTNIYRGDCFVDSERLISHHKPTVGILNPPYKSEKDDREELEFVLNNLNSLKAGGTCVAIVPMSCATATSGVNRELKKTLLREHTLEAVLSMPIELFHNSKTSTVTCTMIFTAHRPHPVGKKTWFGYCRDDGFTKSKNRGRTDATGAWDAIKEKWITSFTNREVIPGFSEMVEVTASHEWCAEAYMQTDYSKLTRDEFLNEVKKYALYQAMLDIQGFIADEVINEEA